MILKNKQTKTKNKNKTNTKQKMLAFLTAVTIETNAIFKNVPNVIQLCKMDKHFI